MTLGVLSWVIGMCLVVGGLSLATWLAPWAGLAALAATAGGALLVASWEDVS